MLTKAAKKHNARVTANAKKRLAAKAKASISCQGTKVKIDATHGCPLIEIEKTGPFASLTLLHLKPAQAQKLGEALIAAAKATK